MLVLLASLPPTYESLVTTFLGKKSTIKMIKVTMVILQSKVLRRENQTSSSDGGSSFLVVSKGVGGSRRSGRGSHGG